MLIDSHAHITFEEYNKDLKDVIQRSFVSGTQIINASNNYKTSQLTVQLAEKHNGMWAIIGCHPDDIYLEEVEINKYRDLSQSSEKVVGIGEVGLDFFRITDENNSLKQIIDKQTEVFNQFIKLSQEINLPLVMHCRGDEKNPYVAYDLMLEILKDEVQGKGAKLRGVIHCYGGNLKQAKEFIDLGFYIGFTGIVTFKNAKELQEIAKEIPLDKILIETDAPFLAPEPYRGKRNEPAYVKYVAQKIAELKDLDFDEVEKQTYKNTVKLFNLEI